MRFDAPEPSLDVFVRYLFRFPLPSWLTNVPEPSSRVHEAPTRRRIMHAFAMPTFERSIEVPAPREALFWWMQDYDRRLEWDSFLIEARLIGGATRPDVGVRAWCVDRSGRGMETEYVSFKPPERVAVRMTRGPWMFGAFAGTWSYRVVNDETTRVTFRYHVEARPRLGRLTDVLVERIFARAMGDRLATLRIAAARRFEDRRRVE